MPATTKCPHCGATLKARELTLMGKKLQIGYENCNCENAKRELQEVELAEERAAKLARERRAAEPIIESGIPPRYRDATHPLGEDCAKAVLDGKNLYIHGDVGTGKTYLAAATSRLLIMRGIGVKFTSMWGVLDEIKDSFRSNANPLSGYQKCKVLVLDDFGKESPTDFALERMFALIDNRSNWMLPTIITTQYLPGQLMDRLAKNGDRDTAKAIISRLRQNCVMKQSSGEDRRKTCSTSLPLTY